MADDKTNLSPQLGTKESDTIQHDQHYDGIDRRGFLKCMAWAGTGLVCVMSGGILRSFGLSDFGKADAATMPIDFAFVQISDSHIGFSKDTNKDVVGTLQAAVDKINGLSSKPAFLLHTGDLSHLSKPEEFDTLDQILKGGGFTDVHYVPGEHDVIGDDGKQYLARYGKGTKGDGWYSFDYHGVHFIGLVNVMNLKPGGLGSLGQPQLDWLQDDVRHLRSSTPLVVFAHVPLWTVYPDWGWGTDDGALALSYLKRFGSVTVLNGHIHQTLQKVEGNVTFHTAMSTAFPQPAPGAAPSPGPMKVPADQLRTYLGITSVNYVEGRSPLAIVDSPLAQAMGAMTPMSMGATAPTTAASTASASGDVTINIDNFTFMPTDQTIRAGAQITWINKDDIPHTVVSVDGQFKSGALDTDQKFSYRFAKAGTYSYYCSIHPKMTAKIVVK